MIRGAPTTGCQFRERGKCAGHLVASSAVHSNASCAPRFVDERACLFDPSTPDANFEILGPRSSPILGLFRNLSYGHEFADLEDG